MLTYRAAYKFLGDSVHAEVVDFPGAISFGQDLDDARRMLQSALVDLAETRMLRGDPLPTPDPSLSDCESDLEEPIPLKLPIIDGDAFRNDDRSARNPGTL